MAGEHTVLSPSKGEMILNCPAALGASKGVVDAPSKFAAEGTAYHEVASKVLEHCKRIDEVGYDGGDENGTDCAHHVGYEIEADGFKFTIDAANAEHAQVYVDNVRALGGLQYYEQRLDTSDVVGVPGQGGTTDAVILDFENSTIRIRDFKFGMRPVYAPGNKQYLQYGAAALFKYRLLHDWQFLEVGTEQPRVPGGNFDKHTYPVSEVWAWVAENLGKFQLAYHLYEHPEEIKPEHFNPTDKGCEWCPIRGSCAARNRKFIDLFPKVSAKPLTQMDNAELAKARNLIDSFESWAASIKAEAHQRAVVLGQHLPGWMVVQGRKGNRKWDGEGVENILVSGLGDSAYKPRELISPAEAEKKLKKHSALWDTLQSRITQSEGSPSLVRADSAKAEVKSGVEFPLVPDVG